ncbi:MAG: histidine kinase [Alphaproteobacteria bacterium]|nr:histidine kinase [Alphaproteobacteria bacterium]
MWGRIAAGVIVLTALVAGVAVYYLQEYAYYSEAAFEPGREIMLTPIESDLPEPILAEGIIGIDAESSPLRFRACFRTPLTQGMLSETYQAYEGATPLNAPSWFDCFDAQAIGVGLENGEALAFLSQSDIAPDVDRVVAVFADGRAYAWHQFRPGALEGN